MDENKQGNSEVDQKQQAEQAIFDSSNFFDGLENSVNGMQTEDGEDLNNTTEVTQNDSCLLYTSPSPRD